MATAARPQWSSITDAERPWMRAWLAEPAGTQRELLRALRAAGFPQTVCSGVIVLVMTKAMEEPDGIAPKTRSAYRKALRTIGPPRMYELSPSVVQRRPA